ncbi:hypothetical protein EJB05_03869 [Eragrostis curvula]|uniref:Uncharacterized protein n=1 Tax=Eragrostis curvula TaxID=38414 RepID=A0A5J9W8G6_9POAL|nr:hypothetical protein EJB05_03869 [Eragrostis curvula]
MRGEHLGNRHATKGIARPTPHGRPIQQEEDGAVTEKDNVGVVKNSMTLSDSDLTAGKQDNNGTKNMMQTESDMLDTMMTDGRMPLSFIELLMQGKAYTDYNTLNNDTLNEVHDTVNNLCGKDEDESNYTRNDLIPDCNPWDKSIFEKMNIETRQRMMGQIMMRLNKGLILKLQKMITTMKLKT